MKCALLAWIPSDAFCDQNVSHNANAKNPLNMSDATREKLTNLNAVDIHLYNELRSCSFPDYSIPAFDPTRFESNDTLR